MRLVVIIQASMRSCTLPGSPLLPVTGESMLAAMVRRVRAARVSFEICVATSFTSEDDPVAELSSRLGVRVYRGHPTDLLERHYEAARERRVDAVAKIPSPCPLVDPAAIERVLSKFRSDPDSFDYVSNLHPATYPDGNDVEVMPFDTLEMAYACAERAFEREHTTPYIWVRPRVFRIGNVMLSVHKDYSGTHRFRLQYPEDFQFVTRIFDELGGSKQVFPMDDILRLLVRKPEIAAINSRYQSEAWYRAPSLGQPNSVEPLPGETNGWRSAGVVPRRLGWPTHL